jgi:hypothetical protein
MAAVSFLGKTSAAAAPADAEAVKDGQVDIPSTVPSSEASDVSPEVSPPPEKRGFDIVTLGCLTNEQMLPAFGSTKNRSLIALLSGSPEKRRFGRQYGWSSDALDDYSQPERLKERDDGKVVYIVLPESMHNELILRLSTINNNVFCQRLWSKRKLTDRMCRVGTIDANLGQPTAFANLSTSYGIHRGSRLAAKLLKREKSIIPKGARYGEKTTVEEGKPAQGAWQEVQ